MELLGIVVLIDVNQYHDFHSYIHIQHVPIRLYYYLVPIRGFYHRKRQVHHHYLDLEPKSTRPKVRLVLLLISWTSFVSLNTEDARHSDYIGRQIYGPVLHVTTFSWTRAAPGMVIVKMIPREFLYSHLMYLGSGLGPARPYG